MDFTEFCDSCVFPLYEKEGELPKCPPGYRWDQKIMMCVPKTPKDAVGPNQRSDKDMKPGNGPSYNTWGPSGYNGDGYAFEEPNEMRNESEDPPQGPRNYHHYYHGKSSDTPVPGPNPNNFWAKLRQKGIDNEDKSKNKKKYGVERDRGVEDFLKKDRQSTNKKSSES